MADERIEDISGGALTAIAADDKLVILDTSDTTDDAQGTAKHVTTAVLGLLATGATKTASFTAAVGELYPISMASLAANIDVTFPSTPAAGDMFGFYVAIQNTTDTASSGFALAPFWGVEPLATTSINGVSYTQATGDGGGKWCLFINFERLVFRYDAVASTWMVLEDGRVCHIAEYKQDTAQTGIAVTTDTTVTISTSETDNAGLGDTTGNRIWIKRSGLYAISTFARSNTAMDDNTRVDFRLFKNTTRTALWQWPVGTSASGKPAMFNTRPPLAFLAGDYYQNKLNHTHPANIALSDADDDLKTRIGIEEKL